MRYLLIIIFLSVLIGCSTSEKRDIQLKRGNAVINGKVENYENKSKVISFRSGGVVEEISQTAIIDSLGNFRTEIELFNPQDVNLFYENGFAQLFLKPSDSLFLNIDANSFKQERYPYYDVSGSNPSTSKNIRDFLQFHDQFFYEPKFDKSVEEYLIDLEQQIAIEDSIRNEFANLHNPTEEFMYWAEKNMIYGFANYLLRYFAHYDINYKEQKVELYESNLFPVDDDSAIVGSSYKLHLEHYLMVKYFREDSVFTKLIEENDAVSAYSRIIDSISKNEKQGLSRDIMYYVLFNNLYMDNMEDFAFLFSRYGANIKDKELFDVLQEKRDNFKSRYHIEEATLDLELNAKSERIQKFWKTIKTKHKDKIIYVDIWATWCGPCRSEIPHAIDLHNYFEGKPVAFVNLCLASNKEDWKKMVAKNNIKGDNYFFNKDETALLRDELKFAGYPTYMIIDKKGDLINKNAPRPSSGDKIKNVINKLLDETFMTL